MTEQLYYTDIKQGEFEANITEVNTRESALVLELDKTCFYPEGGGQPADKGKLDGVLVADVQKVEGKIIHTLKPAESQLHFKAGDKVHGVVDMNWRLEYMQQHTGQHILSAALLSEAGCNTVAVHLGEEYVTIEVDQSEITPEDVEKVENRALEVIAANRPVHTRWVTDTELSSYSLRRPTKKTGKIRLVIIEDTDCAACGGLHSAATGQIKLVHWIGSEKIRGNARLYWKVGDRAIRDYRSKSGIVRSLNARLSVQNGELTDRVEKIIAENRELKQDLAAFKKHLAVSEATELHARSTADEKGVRLIVRRSEDEDPAYVKELMENLIQHERVCCCFFNEREEHSNWMIGCSEDLDLPFSEVRQDLLTSIDGKGGGKKPTWQGMGKNIAGLDQFVNIVRRNLG